MPTGVYDRKHKRTLAEKRARANERQKQMYRTKAGKDYNKNLKLKRTYGITLEEYRNFLNFCGNVCGICGDKCPSGRSLAVDHDHETGIIRGLLCVNCNKGLGNFKDNITLLKTAIIYLESYKEALEEQNAINTRGLQESISAQCGDRNEIW